MQIGKRKWNSRGFCNFHQFERKLYPFIRYIEEDKFKSQNIVLSDFQIKFVSAFHLKKPKWIFTKNKNSKDKQASQSF